MSSVSAVITFLKKLSKQAVAERRFLVHCIAAVPRLRTVTAARRLGVGYGSVTDYPRRCFDSFAAAIGPVLWLGC